MKATRIEEPPHNNLSITRSRPVTKPFTCFLREGKQLIHALVLSLMHRAWLASARRRIAVALKTMTAIASLFVAMPSTGVAQVSGPMSRSTIKPSHFEITENFDPPLCTALKNAYNGIMSAQLKKLRANDKRLSDFESEEPGDFEPYGLVLPSLSIVDGYVRVYKTSPILNQTIALRTWWRGSDPIDQIIIFPPGADPSPQQLESAIQSAADFRSRDDSVGAQILDALDMTPGKGASSRFQIFVFQGNYYVILNKYIAIPMRRNEEAYVVAYGLASVDPRVRLCTIKLTVNRNR